jgi:hypothetical protein
MRHNAPMMHVGAFEDMCSSLSFHLAERNYVVGERVAHVVFEGDIQILRSVSDPTSMGTHWGRVWCSNSNALQIRKSLPLFHRAGCEAQIWELLVALS